MGILLLLVLWVDTGSTKDTKKAPGSKVESNKDKRVRGTGGKLECLTCGTTNDPCKPGEDRGEENDCKDGENVCKIKILENGQGTIKQCATVAEVPPNKDEFKCETIDHIVNNECSCYNDNCNIYTTPK